MATLTKADAARQLGISRTTLYKLIDQGKLSATPEGLIDTAELVRVMSTVNVHRERPRAPLDTIPLDTYPSHDERRGRPVNTSSEHLEQMSSERQLTSTYRDLLDILRAQLQAAQERERDYREHIAQLTTMLEQAHQQNQRLLDMPRSAPPPRPSPGPPPRPEAPREARTGDPRGNMRRRIVALVREYPQGLTATEIRATLGVDRSLTDTCIGMVRDGLLQRMGRGRYVVAETARHDWLGMHDSLEGEYEEAIPLENHPAAAHEAMASLGAVTAGHKL
jgi:Helix-turn-helix domain